ncbi:amidase [Pollutimonas subterranea]|uniref:amidase n=1 Tax=Pollutimonas subterranea TaxID=2045210 RepID=UPI001303F73D|nr:amidase [Pollutimonas subterranea]
MRTAEELDADVVTSASAPLRAMPFGVKDVINVGGLPTKFGVAASSDQPVRFDSACVEQLRSAGAIPVGKTVTAEYAFRNPGPTRNPWNIAHTPGGSSSGSAAAVAAGMVPAALSTQTGGSIIRPAAYCGVVGFKPSFGLVSRDGLKLTSESLDVIGWHAASVDYAKVLADVLLPKMPAMTTRELRGIQVAITLHGSAERPDPEVVSTLRHVQKTLERRGAHCVEISIDKELDLLARAHTAIMKYEFARNLAPAIRQCGHLLSASLLNNVEEGFAVPDSLYFEMCAVQRELRTSWHDLSNGADLILTPSASGAAPLGQVHTGAPAFNKMWSVLGWPCLHIPVGVNSNNLPIGVQLIADWHHDFSLLELATTIEEQLNQKGDTND